MQKYEKAFNKLKESYFKNEKDILNYEMISAKFFKKSFDLSEYISAKYPYKHNDEKIKKVLSIFSKIKNRSYSYNFDLYQKTRENLINLLTKDYNKIRDEKIKLCEFYSSQARYFKKKSELLFEENQKLIKKVKRIKEKYKVA